MKQLYALKAFRKLFAAYGIFVGDKLSVLYKTVCRKSGGSAYSPRSFQFAHIFILRPLSYDLRHYIISPQYKYIQGHGKITSAAQKIFTKLTRRPFRMVISVIVKSSELLGITLRPADAEGSFRSKYAHLSLALKLLYFTY